MSTKREQHSATILDGLLSEKFGTFATHQLSEEDLERLANLADEEGKMKDVAQILMRRLTKRRSRAFDWNCGSFIQHTEPELVFALLPSEEQQRKPLYESIGLTWCLGEFGRRNQTVIDFLEATVKKARNPESWWRAAFALEKLGLVDAVSYLKSSLRSQSVPPLAECLEDLSNERNRIGILLHSRVENLNSRIIPTAKRILCDRNSQPLQCIGAAWIVGRYRYLDNEVQEALGRRLRSDVYEVVFYVLQAIREIGSPHFLGEIAWLLDSSDPLLRKIAAQALGKIDEKNALELIEARLLRENDSGVIAALTKSLYTLVHHSHRQSNFIRRTIRVNENGMIRDEGDKWYVNPDIYHVFSENQDPENLCFKLALSTLPKRDFKAPIDIGSGTGKFAWYLLERFFHNGRLTCVDASEQMCEFLDVRRKREGILPDRLDVKRGPIAKLSKIVGRETSDLVVANFAFPSKISDVANSKKELQEVYSSLRPGGFFITVGWDETFNDELSEMWYKYVPDGIVAGNFEEWRQIRVGSLKSARNVQLTWFKRGIRVPLEFPSYELAARVMGYLFGRGAADEILYSRRTRWSMSVGITRDTKERLATILDRDGLPYETGLLTPPFARAHG